MRWWMQNDIRDAAGSWRIDGVEGVGVVVVADPESIR